jgi:hypothetical protein
MKLAMTPWMICSKPVSMFEMIGESSQGLRYLYLLGPFLSWLDFFCINLVVIGLRSFADP